MPPLDGIHHLAISVSSLDRSRTWYRDVLDFDLVTDMPTDEFDATVLRHPSGVLLKLMQHRVTANETFDERRTGLDHLAFAVTDSAAVDDWVQRLEAAGVPNTGAKSGALPGSRLVVFRDPDGVQLEIYSS